MAAKITGEMLESYLKCRYKGHLKLTGEVGEKTDYEILMTETRERVRQAATERLLTRHGEGEVLRGVAATPDVLRQKTALILDAVMEDADFCVRFDALQRVAGPSSLGDFHYVPVLFHEAEKAGREHRVLLDLLGLILGSVQGREPACGVLFHGRSCEMRRPRLQPGGRQARRLMQEIRELRVAETPPRLTLNSHCQVCEFRQQCKAEATGNDDMSLLRGMGEKEIKKYGKRGIFTVTQLSFTFHPPRRMKKPQDRKLVHSHALQALAVREKKVYLLGNPDLPVSAKRIYFDMEGDPERGFCYLAGLIARDGEAEERHLLWIDSPADEPELLARVLEVAGHHPNAWLFAYGGYEAAFLRRVGKAAGRQEEVAAILARMCNVLSVVHTHVYFPVYSNGLKEVAAWLGFGWTEPDASGIQSVVWRRRWEGTGNPAWKEKLTTYNREDCEALRRLTEFLYAACSGQPTTVSPQAPGEQSLPAARVEERPPLSSRREWCRADFAIPDFQFINERAYFDYQRDRIFVRTSKVLRESRLRNRGRTGKRNIPVNRRVELNAEKCPFCGCEELTRVRHGTLVRLGFDLRVTRGGIRRWVTRFTTSYHDCGRCGKRFLPWEYLRLDPHCHCLKSWAMNQHVVRRTTLANVAEMIKENFALPVFYPEVRHFKKLLAGYYQPTWKRLMEKLVAGNLIHADETEVHLKHGGKGYVWVFTNLEEVVFLYRPTREGGFLHELLKDFRGVLVSDFYAAYDSLDCPQQKCLVHLIRDFNQDIHANPWDEELKSLAREFGTLLRTVVATIDGHGLQSRHLGRHKRDVDRFFGSVATAEYRSEVAEGYRTRLLKYRGKLFTFLEHDGVPWNNNNAEYAVKRFAYYREIADGLVWEHGLSEYLVLLSICLTCKYKGVSFLKFLLSRETDIAQFCRNPGRKRPIPTVELLPEGWTISRRKRKQSWDEECRSALDPSSRGQDTGEGLV